MTEATTAILPPRTSSVGSSTGVTAAIGAKDPELLLDAIDSSGAGRYNGARKDGEVG